MIEFTSWEEPVIGLEVRPFNWRLRKARQARGWTRAELARQAGISNTVVGRAEKLQHVSDTAREKMAFALQIPEDELFPGVIDALLLKRTEAIEVPFEERHVQRWLSAAHEDPLDAEQVRGEMRAALAQALRTLSPRLQQVITLRFGLDGGGPRHLDAVGEVMGVTRERIRQMEASALRTLRHPLRTRPLRDFLQDTGGRDRQPALTVAETPIPRRHPLPPTDPDPRPFMSTRAVRSTPRRAEVGTPWQRWLRREATSGGYDADGTTAAAQVLARWACCMQEPTFGALWQHYTDDHGPVHEDSQLRLRALAAAYARHAARQEAI